MRNVYLLVIAVVLMTLVSVQAMFLRVGADIATSFIIFGLGYAARLMQEKK
jgi:hypothetical protein